MIWLLVVCVPAQASAAVSLRAKGPAHAHVEVPGAAQSAVQAIEERDAEHAAWHAHEHEGSRAAHHDHDTADASVILIASPGDDDHGAGGGAGNASVIEMPGLLPSSLGSPIALAGRGLIDGTAVAFESRAALPLYRPPR
ncbi:MAG: hypothetical protein ABIX12_12550 [Rubrivivax sp.]